MNTFSIAISALSLEKLDAFLALAAKDLSLSPLNEDLQRFEHNFLIHAMEL